ncbi:MAG: DedA family protein [Alicyclobacillus sp.]|nr:DedA family protein [Alicyclobacillus sp.]
MLDWFGHLAEAVYAWGYTGIFAALIIEGLGLPFPGDAVMAFYGVAAASGQFHPIPLIAASVFGYMTAAVAAYVVSRRYGANWLDRLANARWFSARSMSRTSGLLSRYGPLLLIPGRFLPGVRSASSYVAGALRMEFGRFLVYTTVGVVAWCSLWVMVGYWCGEYLDGIFHTLQSSLTYVTGAALVVAVVVWAVRRTRHAR